MDYAHYCHFLRKRARRLDADRRRKSLIRLSIKFRILAQYSEPIYRGSRAGIRDPYHG